MRRILVSILALVVLTLPTSTHAQSGDASWLNSLEGLQTGVGRSWMEEITFESSTGPTVTATPDSEATPAGNDEGRILTLSALVFEFDTPEHAATGLEMLNDEQIDMAKRDPRSPATQDFDVEDLGEKAYGHEGSFEAPGIDGTTIEIAVVYLMVQDGPYVYQIFGQFLPGDHIEFATTVVSTMVAADAGDAEPIYDMAGASTGGSWEKLNALDIDMPEGSTVTDLQIFPPSDDAVMGESVVVPVIELDNLASVPGLVGSWHMSYGPERGATPVATPIAKPEGVFSIELWIMEFSDPTNASAAMFAMNNTLSEPLGIVTGESGDFAHQGERSISLVSTGFVQDRALPEGDAAVVTLVIDSTVYAARVYSNDVAPTPIAKELVQSMIDTPAGDGPETVDGAIGIGGGWDRFPQAGDDALHNLVPIVSELKSGSDRITATPAG